MGNQQRNSNKDLGWLGGFIDGEGSLMVVKRSKPYKTKTGAPFVLFDPAIKVSGTELSGLHHLTKILDNLELPYHVSWRMPKNALHKKSWMMEVKGVKRCYRWCLILLDCLVIKKDDAKNMLEYCHSRLNQTPDENDRRSRSYTERQYELIHALRGRRIGTRLC